MQVSYLLVKRTQEGTEGEQRLSPDAQARYLYTHEQF